MIKKTLCFTNPAYLSLRDRQLRVQIDKTDTAPERVATVPIEDIGVVVLEHRQITITHAAIAALLENEVALITCDERHMPTGLMLPLEGHTLQSERFQAQIEASLPLRKQLWQQTVECKIINQSSVLHSLRGTEVGCMKAWAKDVRSGDSTNLEGRAAAYYWRNMFPELEDFTREADGGYPNSMLNYGYAILRAVVARSLVASGLLPTLGIHHHNRYNAYCLADDVMEPYRPLVDRHVVDITRKSPGQEELTPEIKRMLLTIPTIDVRIGGQRSPLLIAVTQTTASLAKCFLGEIHKITYPTIDESL